MNILIVEDDPDIAELVSYNLEKEKFRCHVCGTGGEGIRSALKQAPDLVILDLMLPDMGGLGVCRRLKMEPATKHVPIVMVTARGEEIDKIVGFEVGADDYITKPFSPRELVLRVKAILARAGPREGLAKVPIVFGILSFDPVRPMTKVGGVEISLTRTELKVLGYLLSMKGRVATREMLLDKVWGTEVSVTTRTVDTHMKRLRTKLGKAGAYFETVHGIGYRFREKP